MKKVILNFLLLCLICCPSWAQTTKSLDTLLNSGSMWTFLNNSNTDQENYRKLKLDYFPYSGPEFTNFCSSYLPPSEAIDTLTFSNLSSTNLSDFYFFLNDRLTMNLDSLVPQIFAGCITEKEKVQALYQYVKESHLYYFAVDKANPIYENYNAAKMLNVYGIGNCGMIANLSAQLAAMQSGTDQKHWYISYGTHGISELTFDSTNVFLDADEDGMYLLPDNTTLASFYDVFMDSHLYMRTKHFGNATPYNYDWNLHFNEPIRWGGHYVNHTDTLLNVNEPCCPKLNALRGENIKINLKPNSSISFIPNDTLSVFHFVHTEPAPTMATVLGNLGKGILKSNFAPINLQAYPSFLSWNNMQVNSADSSYGPAAIQQAGQMSISESCPYAMSDATLRFNYRLNSNLDTIKLYFSKDGSQWSEVNWSKQYGPQWNIAEINLVDYILPYSTQATYQYFIRWELITNNNTADASISLPNLTSQFQYNKLTGPQLKRGLNNLKIYSSGNSPIQCHIRWTEETSNQAPLNNFQAIFPADSQLIDSTDFTFRWNIPTDPDGDSIIDYQIQVSDRSDMRFPLSTLHDRYMKLTNGGLPEFTPEVKDYYNHLTPYYWRVRAQDSKGVWSNWSATFSFQVKTPMYPRNIRWQKIADTLNDLIELTWDFNNSGDSVHYYKVMGSGNILGFEANDSKLYGNTISNKILVHFPTGRKRYRVRAVGNNSTESPASFYINLPLPRTKSIGNTFNYIDTFTVNLECDAQPFPPVGLSNRPVFYVVDPAKIQLNGQMLTAIDSGVTIVDLCTRINQDTIRLLSVLLTITGAGPIQSKPSLVIWAKDTSSTYGNPVIHNGFKYTGFIGNHNSGILNTLPVMTTNASNLSDAGLYNLHPTGAISSLYNIFYQPGILTIKKRPLTIYPVDTTITYGTQNFLAFNGVGFVNGDGPANFQEMPTYITTCSALSLPGSYGMSLSGGKAKNYAITTYLPGVATVIKAPLTAYPSPCVSTYGEPPSSAGITYSGFQNGEDSSILTQQPSIVFSADSSSPVGIYSTMLTGGTSDRYTIIKAPSTLEILKASLQLTAKDTFSIYGDNPPLNGLQFNGFKNNDTPDSLDVLPQMLISADSLSPAGTYTIQLQGGMDNNYQYILQNGLHTIQKAPLSVHPIDTTIFYGDHPQSGFAGPLWISGFKNNDSISDLAQIPTLSTTANQASPVGLYTISAGGGFDTNYYFLYNNAILEIIPSPLQISVPPSQSTYGEVPQTSAINYQGFKLNDGPNSLSAIPTTTTIANNTSHVGTYPVQFQNNGISSPNYSITWTPGIHTIYKKSLVLSATDLQKNYLAPLPELRLNISGFVNNDTLDDLDQYPKLSTECTPNSYPGIYPITISPVIDNDYVVTTNAGTMEVIPNLPKVELPLLSQETSKIIYQVKVSESGGEITDLGIEISKKADAFNVLSKIVYHDMANLTIPYLVNYIDSLKLQIPNEEFLIRAYASNSSGISYSPARAANSFLHDFLFIRYQANGSSITIKTGQSFLHSTATLFSFDGKKIISTKVEDFDTKISLPELPIGMYFLKLQSKDLIRTKFEKILIR